MPEVSNRRSYESVTHDIILTDRMEPMFAKEPAEVLRRIRYGTPDHWTHVFVGESQKVVTIAEYLHGEKHKTVIKMLEELLSKKDKPIFASNPDLFAKQVDRTARKLIERIIND
jgi:hypothetical protein